MPIIDISPEITSDLAVWPGDTPFSQRFLCRLEEGSNIDLSTVETTVHLGAHTDAPSHYVRGGETMEQRDLQRYYGLCQVIHVELEQGTRIRPEDLRVSIMAERVLFATGSYPDPNNFNRDFCALSPALIEYLGAAGVLLVGIDTPSVDLCDSKALESHSAIAKYDMAILEGVVLSHVPEGIYTLAAFPLRIVGADASPVRAVLIT